MIPSRAATSRVRFVHGQRLEAADLAAATGAELRRQELHVAAAHRTWGVAYGLECRPGTAGARVSPGVAFDAYGRLLRVPRSTRVAPAAGLIDSAAEIDLVVSWAKRGTRVALIESAEVRLGIDVPLARFPVGPQGLGAPELGVRRGIRSLAAPRIGSGEQDVEIQVSQGAVQAVTIDTSSAAFTSTPSYVVTPRVARAADVEARRRAAWHLAGPFLSVVETTRTHIGLELRASRGKLDLPLTVAWLGVESAPGCPLLSTYTPLTTIEVR